MDEAVYREIEQLQSMPVAELQQRYQEVFGPGPVQFGRPDRQPGNENSTQPHRQA